MRVRCPHCDTAVDVGDDHTLSDILCSSCGSGFNLVDPADTQTITADPQSLMMGRFSLLQHVGMGQFGSVWKANDAELDRTVALKMPRRGELNEVETQWFLREARAAAQLKHPNIVGVHEIGRDATNETVYIVSDFIDGVDLKEYMSVKKLPLRRSIDLCTTIARALHHAHDSGVVHRDLKPGNVMIDADGQPHIMDFGLAKRETGEVTMTVDGRILGTPAYMSPEQARGEAHDATAQSDIYSLGVMLYELLTGQLPFQGNTRMLIMQVLNDPPPRPRSLNRKITRDLEAVVLKCLEKDPKKRYASAFEVADDLARVAAGLPIKASQGALTLRLARRMFGNLPSAMRFLGICVFIIVACGLTVVAVLYQQAESARVEAVENVKKAERQMGIAKAQTRIADMLRKEADLQRERAEKQKKELEAQRAMALKEKQEADKQRDRAEYEKGRAEEQRSIAEQQQEEAVRQTGIAASAEREAKYDSYVALIAAADAAITRNAFAQAREALKLCDPAYRNWEWGRLSHLAHQSSSEIDTNARVYSIAHDSSRARLIIGGARGARGIVEIWEYESSHRIAELDVSPATLVRAVAISPDGRWIATGSNHTGGCLKLWNANTGAMVREFAGHHAEITSLNFSPDGRTLLSTSRDRTARIWDVEAGQQVGQPLTHAMPVWDGAFSPDGKQIATASRWAYVWTRDESNDSWTPSAPFRGHESDIYAIAFAPDDSLDTYGRKLVSGGLDGRVLLWDVDEQPSIEMVLAEQLEPAEVRRIPHPSFTVLGQHTAAVHDIEFATLRNGHQTGLLASCGADNTVRLWDVRQGNEVVSLAARHEGRPLRGHGQEVLVCAFINDGKSLLSAGLEPTTRLWDISKYEEVRILQRGMPEHAEAVLSASFGPANQVVTASKDRTALVWDTSRQTATPSRLLREGHEFLTTGVAVFPSPHDHLVATSAVDDTTRIWDLERGVELVELNGTGRDAALAVSPDGKWVLTGSGRYGADGPIQHALLWDAATGDRAAAFVGSGELTHATPVTAVAFSPDGRLAYTGDFHGRGMVWDVESRQPAKRLDYHTDSIVAAAFVNLMTDEGAQVRLLTASNDTTVSQWDVTNPFDIKRLEKVTLSYNLPEFKFRRLLDAAVSVSPDGKQARAMTVAQPRDSRAANVIRLWDVITGVLLVERSLEGARAVALAENGRLALTIQDVEARQVVNLWSISAGDMTRIDNEQPFLDSGQFGDSVFWDAVFTRNNNVLTVGGEMAQLWNPRPMPMRDRELRRLAPNRTVADANFSPDGSLVVTASWDNSARIWSVADKKAIFKLVGHTRRVTSAVFSPDGRHVLTASSDGTAKLWDASTGECVRTYTGTGGEVLDATFSLDGSLIVTASDDSTATIWRTLEDKEPLLSLADGHEKGYAVSSAAFSPDGRYVVTGGEDGVAIVWDVTSGAVKQRLEAHSAKVTSVTFHPLVRRIDYAVTVPIPEEELRTWEATRAAEIEALGDDREAIDKLPSLGRFRSVTKSESDYRILTGSADFTAKLWDLRAGVEHLESRELLTLEGHTRAVTSVDFSPKGKYALTASEDGTAIIWLATEWK